jgi:hypothetical protein
MDNAFFSNRVITPAEDAAGGEAEKLKQLPAKIKSYLRLL